MIAVLLFAALAADDTPLLSGDLLVSLLQMGERERAEEEAKILREAAVPKAAGVPRGTSRAVEVQRKKAAVQRHKKESSERLARIRDAKGKYLPSLPLPIAPGVHGVLRNELRFVQIVDARNVLVSLGERTYWLENFSTAGMADGQRFTIAGSVAVRETSRQYSTVLGGTKTVLVLTPTRIPDGELDRAAKKAGLRK